MKVQDDARLRAQVAREESEQIGNTALAIHERLQRGGKLIIFGNGGSATDANDLAIDCVLPPLGFKPVPAVSLALEPANITAVANDIGTEAIFLRQLIAQARPEDVAIGDFHQRRIAQHHHGAGRGAQAEPVDGGAARLRRWRDQAQRAGGLSRRGALRLHSSHSGSAGFDLSRDSRIAGGA